MYMQLDHEMRGRPSFTVRQCTSINADGVAPVSTRMKLVVDLSHGGNTRNSHSVDAVRCQVGHDQPRLIGQLRLHHIYIYV